MKANFPPPSSGSFELRLRETRTEPRKRAAYRRHPETKDDRIRAQEERRRHQPTGQYVFDLIYV